LRVFKSTDAPVLCNSAVLVKLKLSKTRQPVSKFELWTFRPRNKHDDLELSNRVLDLKWTIILFM